MMAAQVARACAVFQVDEIVVFNDGQSQNGARPRKGFEGDGYTGYSDPDDNYRVTFIMRNITDESYILLNTSAGQRLHIPRDADRYMGASLRVRI